MTFGQRDALRRMTFGQRDALRRMTFGQRDALRRTYKRCFATLSGER